MVMKNSLFLRRFLHFCTPLTLSNYVAFLTGLERIIYSQARPREQSIIQGICAEVDHKLTRKHFFFILLFAFGFFLTSLPFLFASLSASHPESEPESEPE